MKRKALFFDIDGTLMSEVTHTVPKSASEALRTARELGHLVFINSGRTYSLIGPIKHMVEADGYLCGCGTHIIADGEVLFSKTIPHERGNQIKKDIIAYRLDGILEGTESCYFQAKPSHIPKVERIRSRLKASGSVSPYSWDDDCYDFDKFCVLSDDESDTVGFFRTLGLDFDVIDRGGRFYECVPAGCSKATAIEIILEKYKIPLEDAYVFGDSNNDLSMFEYAKNAVLMGHHDKDLEPYATFITKNVEADGIEYAMKKLGII